MAACTTATPVLVKVKELFQLKRTGTSEEDLNTHNVSMESDGFICVLRGRYFQQITVTDFRITNSHKKPVRHSTHRIGNLRVRYESAIINPTGDVVALRADGKGKFCLWELTMRRKVTKSVELPGDVMLWKWLSATVIAMVTKPAVFHWTMQDQPQKPEKVFDRRPKFREGPVTGYHVDDAIRYKWILVTHAVGGSLELYSAEEKTSTYIDGNVGIFATLKLTGNSKPSTLLCYVDQEQHTNTNMKLYIREVGKPLSPTKQHFRNKEVKIVLPEPLEKSFTLEMQASTKYELLFLTTSVGHIFVHALESGQLIHKTGFSRAPIIRTVPQENTGGLLAVNTNGQVLSVTVDEDILAAHIKSLAKHDPHSHKVGGPRIVSLQAPPINNRFQISLETQHLGNGKNTVEEKSGPGSCVRIENDHLHQIVFKLLDNVAVANSLNLLYGQLELPPAGYHSSRRNNPDDYDFLKIMLAKWIGVKSTEATWGKLAQNLRACQLNDGASKGNCLKFVGLIAHHLFFVQILWKACSPKSTHRTSQVEPNDDEFVLQHHPFNHEHLI